MSQHVDWWPARRLLLTVSLLVLITAMSGQQPSTATPAASTSVLDPAPAARGWLGARRNATPAGQDPSEAIHHALTADFDLVWSAALRVFQQRGEPIIHTDRGNGIISTDYKADEKDEWRHKFSLLLMSSSPTETTISITSVIEKRSGSLMAFRRGRWETQESDGVRERALLHAIEEQVSTMVPTGRTEETTEATHAASVIELERGMTEGQVIELLGEPAERVTFETKAFLRYVDITVALEDGKVADVHMRRKSSSS